jgi:Ni,Fe-hydrogenase III small subunit
MRSYKRLLGLELEAGVFQDTARIWGGVGGLMAKDSRVCGRGVRPLETLCSFFLSTNSGRAM